MRALEMFSKAATLVSIPLIIFLQLAFNPDMTWRLRAASALALVAGWAAGRAASHRGLAVWLFAAPLAPALLRAFSGREGPVLDIVWMAGLAAALLGTVSWSRWHMPEGWRVLLGGWALTLSLAWPILMAREVSFDPRLLRDMGTINSWAMLAAPQVVGWILHVVVMQLVALVWLDWLMLRFSEAPDRVPLAAHGLWIGTTLSSLVAVYQGAVDFHFLSNEFWAGLRRASGTMLDANAAGFSAAIAGPIVILLMRHLAFPHAWVAAGLAFAVNWAALWLSGSRTALLCGTLVTAALGGALWRLDRDAAARRRAPVLAFLAAAAVAVVVLFSGAIGPVERLLEVPASDRRWRLGDEGDRAAALSSLVNRPPYGPIAAEMIREHPLTGVGIGTYHLLAPDYQRVAADEALPFDNAQNWWRHQVAELGVVGAMPVIAWSGLLAWLVVGGRSRPDRLVAGTTVRGALVGIGISSLVGVPTQSPLVLLWFFLLAAWVTTLVEPRPGGLWASSWGGAGGALEGGGSVGAVGERETIDAEGQGRGHKRGDRLARGLWPVTAAIAVWYAVGQLALARGPLAVEERARRAGREYVVGAYPPEPLSGSSAFRWTTEESHFVWPARTRYLVMKVWAHHPDLEQEPVQITLWTPCGVLLEEVLDSPDEVSIGVELPEGLRAVDVRIRVSRTWQPAAYGGDDRRRLGAGVLAEFAENREAAEEQMRTPEFPSCVEGNEARGILPVSPATRKAARERSRKELQ